MVYQYDQSPDGLVAQRAPRCVTGKLLKRGMDFCPHVVVDVLRGIKAGARGGYGRAQHGRRCSHVGDGGSCARCAGSWKRNQPSVYPVWCMGMHMERRDERRSEIGVS